MDPPETQGGSCDPSRPGFLDPDIAQVERLAGLGGEFLADPYPLVLIDPRRIVTDSVQGARDQDGPGDATFGVDDGAVWPRVVLGIDVGRERRVGLQLGLLDRILLKRTSGCRV